MPKKSQQPDIAAKLDSTWIHWQAARLAAEIINSHGFDAYVIGGAVRDILLGKLPKDFDLVTDAEPKQILKMPEFMRPKFTDSAQAFGVTRVLVPWAAIQQLPGEAGSQSHPPGKGAVIEIATYRRDIEAHLGRKQTKIEFATLEEDVQRRDFTINALALDPASLQLIDHVEGMRDLEKGTVRFIGKPTARIKEDPLRILRAIRLRNQLEFDYSRTTLRAIKRAIADGGLADVAAERARDELSRMLVHPNRRQALVDLDTLGVLAHYMPEVLAMKGTPQPPELHSEGDVWQHTLWALTYLPRSPSVRLVWAVLLHDIGKPPTMQAASETGDRIRFGGHHREGAKIAEQILKRLNFSSKLIAEITWMIHYHMAIDDLPKMRPGNRRKLLDHPAFLDLLELHRADAHAAWGRGPDGTIDTTAAEFKQLEELYAHHRQQHRHNRAKPAPSLKHDLGIDGHWLKAEFEIAKGALIGAVLEELEQLYAEGAIRSRADAEQAVRRILGQRQ